MDKNPELSDKGRAGDRPPPFVLQGEYSLARTAEAGRMGPFNRYLGQPVACGGDSQGKGEHPTLTGCLALG